MGFTCGYPDERGTQIVVSLLKAHGVRRVIANPGVRDICVTRSVQLDPFFEVYSSVDERSAAYMACGMAAESGEPVALCCTGATASRNYYPGLTEAYYRNLPIVAITCSNPSSYVGHLDPQTTDRSAPAPDVVRKSVEVPFIKDKEDAWAANVAVNDALLELRHRCGGPVHINLVSNASRTSFDQNAIPQERIIRRHVLGDELPDLPSGRIAVFVGSHHPFSRELSEAIESFCSANDAVVICDHTSNYRGAHRVLAPLVVSQDEKSTSLTSVDLLIHLGGVSGAYIKMEPKRVWRVSLDGAVIDTFKKLVDVFEMDELSFFRSYASGTVCDAKNAQKNSWTAARSELVANMPDLPFSNIWMAQQLASEIPTGSVLHLAILNTLRSWNFFEIANDVDCSSNVGGFGIDGCVSTLLGSAIASPHRLHFGVVGDLAFFYDLNALGNRHLPANLRLLLVNNGHGAEFTVYNNAAHRFMPDTREFTAAAGHFGQQSPDLVKSYCEALGIRYFAANDKDAFGALLPEFLSDKQGDSAMLIEAFTTEESESAALWMMHHLGSDATGKLKSVAKGVLGADGINTVKRMFAR